jgi:hypothetical protein
MENPNNERLWERIFQLEEVIHCFFHSSLIYLGDRKTGEKGKGYSMQQRQIYRRAGSGVLF